ncbi:MAG: outer membrane lipoprotein LolB [Burkholderiaceae bacterium]|jgi:outer membrane lipoprotein LolB|nr:outer membrane lipoprotein LolB [Burkholderiaceae bacterium]
MRPAPRRAWLLAAMAALATLAGCATVPVPPPPERVHTGRFAATTTLDGRSENTTGRFTLAIAGEALTLDLATPLGSTLARIETSPAGAVLRANGGAGMQEARGRDASALAEDLLGFALPVAGIADWIAGRAAPGRPAQLTGDARQPQSIEQDGWRIEVLERTAAGTPRRLAFTRPARAGHGATPPAPAITLRLVLDDATGG